jgi:hypothetical protein
MKEAAFSNVDLEIHSSTKPDLLVAAFGDRVSVLHSGPGTKRKHLLAVETATYYKNPDTTIHALCKIIESLPPAAKRVWKAAHKEFDVGYEIGPTERSSCFSLRPDTLKRVAKLGAFLTVTYYQVALLEKLTVPGKQNSDAT